jgi:hypothetical protein
VTARITALSPGQSPPPVRMAILLFCPMVSLPRSFYEDRRIIKTTLMETNPKFKASY